MKKSRLAKLLSDSIIFAIGNIGTKVIMFIMIPIYTFFLTPANYGVLDIAITTVTLLTPIATLSVFDAVFRFSLDKQDTKLIISNGSLISLIGTLVTLLVGLVISFITGSELYLLVSIMIALNVWLSFFQNFSRGMGQNKLFISLGLVSAFVGSISTFLLLINYPTVNSVLLGNILGLIVANLLGTLAFLKSNYFSSSHISKTYILKLIRYSIPLIPNAVAWWMTNDIARFIILIFIGSYGNGIYAVASKIPALLTIFFGIFNQAWQITAIKEIDSVDNSYFYSKVFNSLMIISLLGTSVMTIAIKPIMHLIVQNNYFESWKLVPILLLSVVFSNLSAFVGSIYVAAKNTNKIMFTTFLGMLVNTLSTLILIPLIGIQGAGVGSFIGFFIILWVRLHTTRDIVKIKMNYVILSSNLAIILIQFTLLLLNFTFAYVVDVFILLALVLIDVYFMKNGKYNHV